MKNELEIKFGSVVYGKINAARMSDYERRAAIQAMHDADALVETFLWVARKIEQGFAAVMLKPSIKH